MSDDMSGYIKWRDVLPYTITVIATLTAGYASLFALHTQGTHRGSVTLSQFLESRQSILKQLQVVEKRFDRVDQDIDKVDAKLTEIWQQTTRKP